MTQDATFEDGREAPLNLGALDGDDLQVLSALAQDAVFPVTEMKWDQVGRRFALLVNRFRWEDLPASERGKRTPERVQSVLLIEHVLGVATSGIDRSDKDMILSLLSLTFEAGEDGAGHLIATLAGHGALRVAVEALEITLKDVTRPYLAPSGKAPDHGE